MKSRGFAIPALLTFALTLGCVGSAPGAPDPNASEPARLATAESSEGPNATDGRGAAPTRGFARPISERSLAACGVRSSLSTQCFTESEQADERLIYLPRLFEDGSLGLRAVVRSVTRPEDPARDAIEHLVRGPTGDERADDFQFALDPRTRLGSVQVAAGTARVDFEAGLDRVHGRPFSELAFWSIVYTLTEVSSVGRVTLFYRQELLRELGSPPFSVPVGAARTDAPDWVRPR